MTLPHPALFSQIIQHSIAAAIIPAVSIVWSTTGGWKGSSPELLHTRCAFQPARGEVNGALLAPKGQQGGG